MSTLGGIQAGLYLRASIQEQEFVAVFTVQLIILFYLSLSHTNPLLITYKYRFSVSFNPEEV